MDFFENIEKTLEVNQSSVRLLELRGFVLTKFVSNFEETTLAMNPKFKETPSPLKEIRIIE